MLLKSFQRYKKTATYLAVFVLTVAVFVFFAQAVLAQASLGIEVGVNTGLGTADLKTIIVRIVQILLGFLGIAAVVVIIYGGYIWMTAAGNEEKVASAKKILVNAIIGLTVILAAFAIVTYVINKFGEATREGEAIQRRPTYSINPGALGAGILQAVYPEPGAHDVARNTLIMVSFREEVDATTIIDSNSNPQACANVPEGTTCGFLRQVAGSPAVLVKNVDESSVLNANQVVAMTNDSHNFVFDPVQYLGDSGKESAYSVNLTDFISKADGSPAFLSGGYLWSFTVSSLLDFTPPKVEGVIPAADPAVAKNTTLQITFNEAVNVVGATGQAIINEAGQLDSAGGSFDNITVSYTDDQGNSRFVSGDFVIANQFRTVTFASDVVCRDQQGDPVAINSCGVVPTCFPGQTDFTVLIKAAQVDQSGLTLDIFSGITDSTGNSLDGNANGLAEGPAIDNYNSLFSTTDQLDLIAPVLISPLEPERNADLVPINQRIKGFFNEYISSSSLNNDTFRVFEAGCGNPADFPEALSCYPEGGFTTLTKNYEGDLSINNGQPTTQVILKTYYPYLNPLTSYNSRLTNGIQDLYQNCFYPSFGPGRGPVPSL
jgi:hypothetical protein